MLPGIIQLARSPRDETCMAPRTNSRSVPSTLKGVAHGTMYGILVRFEDRGWLKNPLDFPADSAR
jgi:hypothetical protein